MREFKSAEKKNKRNPKQIDIDACNKGEAAKSARRELCIIIDGYFIDYRPLDARNNTKEASYLPCHLYRASSNCINDDDIERKEQSTTRQRTINESGTQGKDELVVFYIIVFERGTTTSSCILAERMRAPLRNQ